MDVRVHIRGTAWMMHCERVDGALLWYTGQSMCCRYAAGRYKGLLGLVV
jgi:hypothetical protein